MTNYLNAKNGVEILHSSGTTQILAGAGIPDNTGVEATVGSIYMCTSSSGTIYKKTGAGIYDWIPDYSWPSTATDLNTAHRITTSGNPHTVTLEEARAVSNKLSGDIDFNSNAITSISGISFDGGQEITWNA